MALYGVVEVDGPATGVAGESCRAGAAVMRAKGVEVVVLAITEGALNLGR